MKIKNYPGVIPFLLFAFFSSYVQMGLFVHFQHWLTVSFSDYSFLWRSMLLQFAMFVPCVFMMPVASYFAGRYHKGSVMKWTALGEIGALIAIAVTFCTGVSGAQWVAFGLVLLYGIFHAIMSPAKLGLMKELVPNEDLVKINSWHMVACVLGIAVAAFFGIQLNPNPDAPINFRVVPFIFLGINFIPFILGFFIKVGEQHATLKLRSSKRNFSATWANPIVRLAILGLSVFWGVSQIFLLLSQSMSWTSNATSSVSAIPISVALIGIGFIIGSLCASWVSKGFVETGLIPFSAVIAAAVMFALPFVDKLVNETLVIAVNCVLYAILGFASGLAFVLLRTTIQSFTKPSTAGRIHAVANLIQMSILVLMLGGQTLLMIFAGSGVAECFWFLSIILIISFVCTLKKNTMMILRAGLRFAFAFVFRYRVKILGVDKIPESGPVLLIGPHFSFIDWAVLQMCSPRPLRIASNRNTWADWYQKWLAHGKFLININRRDPKPAMQEIRQALLNNEAVVIFPEGEVSKSPNISKFSLDYSDAIVDTDAQIVPFYIQGLWGGRYSQVSEAIMRPQAFNRMVSVGFGSPMPANATENEIRDSIERLSVSTWDLALSHYKSIVPTWLKAMKKRKNRPILIDPAGKHVSGYDMIRLVRTFRKKIKNASHGEKNIGFMIPTSRDAALGMLSILSCGKTSVNLNYTSPVDVILICMKNANIHTIITTRPFYEKLCNKNAAFAEIAKAAKMIYLDEEESKIGFIQSFISYAYVIAMPRLLLGFEFTKSKLTDTAFILFSSGSEGTPKGVLLSHKNIIANAIQTDCMIRLRRGDVMTAELPLFHSFGLTMTFMMPLLDGVPMVLCPDPTDIKTLARVCAQYKATILMGTPTFVRAFSSNRWVHPMCLDSIRYIVGGAEKVRQEMRESFKLKFGKDIFEAYGATELSPLVTINSPNVLLDDFLTMEKCTDLESVGHYIPGTKAAIIDPETNEFLPLGSEGMVTFAGPQVMLGYLNNPEKTAEVIFEKDGLRWYKTGDKGLLTEDGFVRLLGRYSRFAKLGGEMISLIAVEARLHETGLMEGLEYAVVAIPDSVKGERIVLLYVGEANQDDLQRSLRKSGMPALMIPGSVFHVESIPKLGSGKWDFTNMKKLAISLMENRA